MELTVSQIFQTLMLAERLNRERFENEIAKKCGTPIKNPEGNITYGQLALARLDLRIVLENCQLPIELSQKLVSSIQHLSMAEVTRGVRVCQASKTD